jgi:protein-tyrosine phosphatase
MYDMLRNAKKVSFNNIMDRQVELGGSNIVLSSLDDKEDLNWKDELAKHRHNFIRQFYDYAKDPHGFPERSWNEWLALPAIK